MPPVTVEMLPEKERQYVKRALEMWFSAKDRHEKVCQKADKWYAQYRSYTDFKNAAAVNGRRDVDQVLAEARSGFGADLFIPYTFSIVETTLARAFSQNPTMQVKAAPTQAGMEALLAAEDNADNHRVLLERQMSQTGYNLVCQDVGKEAFITGVGIGKTMFDERVVKGKRVILPRTAPETIPDGQPGSGKVARWQQVEQDTVVYRGPRAEWVSIYDFIIDPAAHDIQGARWLIHRFWLDGHMIKDRVESGLWTLPPGVELEDVLSMGSDEKRRDIMRDRMQQAGFDVPASECGDFDHMGWEVWDHQLGCVTTILDAVVPVQHGSLPYWHMEPSFQAYRPTKVPGDFYGIGEPEAIEDLQHEMNDFRRNRRDNALFVLQRPFAYFRGMVDEADLAWGPGVGIPVDGDPKDLVFFPPIQDVPNSSYQDAEAFARDIERTTGIDDTGSGVAGTGGANATATGVMEVQRAAGLRVGLKTLRFEQELVTGQTRQWVEINKQMIGVGPGGVDEPVAMFGPPRADDPEGIAKGRSTYEMGPATLAGEFDVEPVPNSMAPQNTLEKKQRAMEAYQTFGNDPMIEPVQLREFTLDGFGFDNPKGMIILPGQQFSPEELAQAAEMTAAQLGLDPAQLAELLAQGLEQVKAQEDAAVTGGGQQAPVEVPPPDQQAAA